MQAISLLPFFILSFSVIHCMEFTRSNAITDIGLQKLIRTVNKSSLTMVNIIKEHTQNNNISCIPKNIGALFALDQEKIDELFLTHLEDDDLRPLMRSMGARINAVTKENRNCLWYTKKPALLIQLINEGAELNITDTLGNNCLYNCFYFLEFSDSDDSLEAARILLARGANPNINKKLLYDAAKCQKPETSIKATKLLCEYGADANVKDTLGNTPLIMAIKNKNSIVVELLLEHGANANCPNNLNEHPLHVAVPENEGYSYLTRKKIIPAIVISLLTHGADPNIPYPHSRNVPLHVIIHRNQSALAKQLIEHGAQTDLIGQDDRTPLAIAQRYNYIDCIILLTDGKNSNKIDNVHNEQPRPQEVLTFSMTDFINSQQSNPAENSQNCSIQ